MSGEQDELFPVPDAYMPLWPYVPNPQDVCAPVELDELDELDGAVVRP